MMTNRNSEEAQLRSDIEKIFAILNRKHNIEIHVDCAGKVILVSDETKKAPHQGAIS
jgi:hypothetical protein